MLASDSRKKYCKSIKRSIRLFHSYLCLSASLLALTIEFIKVLQLKVTDLSLSYEIFIICKATRDLLKHG